MWLSTSVRAAKSKYLNCLPCLRTSRGSISLLNSASLKGMVKWSLSGCSYIGQSHMVAILYFAMPGLEA